MEKQEEVVIQNLLNQVNLISKHYDKIASLTGEKFNIFSIMSMEKNEVYTHSAIISELSMKPYGDFGFSPDTLITRILFPINISNEAFEKSQDAEGTWTFYRFATVKGYVDIRWFGTSNGYYSETVTLERL